MASGINFSRLYTLANALTLQVIQKGKPLYLSPYLYSCMYSHL